MSSVEERPPVHQTTLREMAEWTTTRRGGLVDQGDGFRTKNYHPRLAGWIPGGRVVNLSLVAVMSRQSRDADAFTRTTMRDIRARVRRLS